MKNTELIMQYLDGELRGEKLKAFQNELDKNEDLVNEILLHQEIDESILDEEAVNFHNALQDVHKEFLSSKPKRITRLTLTHKTGILKYYGIAAAITIISIMTIAYFTLFKNRKYSNQQLFSMYYERYEPDIITRSGVEETDNLHNALKLYINKDYELAISEFSIILDRDNSMYAALFYRGLSNIETANYHEAIQDFKKISEANNIFVSHAKWYLALCYVRENKDKEAVTLLKEIIDDEGYYSAKASKILNSKL